MIEEQILENENTDVQEEESIISEFASTPESETVALVIQPEEIDLSSSFFMGVQITGVMCMLSLGVCVILRMFKFS